MMRSGEPGEMWAYCFVDQMTYDVVVDAEAEPADE